MKDSWLPRARIILGAVLLMTAGITWLIALMMTAHGQSVHDAPEYLRSTILTFKRKAAVGTLVLTILSAWLLLPLRRSKWPALDGALALVLLFLAGSSVYAFVTIPKGRSAAVTDENVGTSALADGTTANEANASEPLQSTSNIPPIATWFPTRDFSAHERVSETQSPSPPRARVDIDRTETAADHTDSVDDARSNDRSAAPDASQESPVDADQSNQDDGQSPRP